METNSSAQTIPNIPSELLGSVPRKIRRSSGSSSLLPIVLAALIVAPIIASLWYCEHVVVEMQHRSALRRDGVEVPGEIISLKRAGRSPYVIRYTFPVNGGAVADKSDVPLQLLRTLEGSTTTAIRYLPSNPAINHPAAWEWSLSSEWEQISMLLGLFIVSGVTLNVAYKERKLLIWGKPTLGIVTDCRTGGRGSISVNYEFRTETGAQYMGSGESSNLQEIGASICVLYLPLNPSRNLAYPIFDFEIDD